MSTCKNCGGELPPGNRVYCSIACQRKAFGGNPVNRFKPGCPGNPKGRPRGARNRFAEAFWVDVYDAWERHGAAAIKRAMDKDPVAFIRVAVRLFPEKFDIEETAPADFTAKVWRAKRLLERLAR
jgi:hypothetical protein